MPQSRDNSERAACVRWEALLADAVDGELKSGDEAEFASHMAACTDCAALFDAARKGREWLEFLAAEPEVPAGMLEKILARTGPGHEAVYPAAATAGGMGASLPEPWQRPGFVASLRRFAEPRLMMTAAMAFFSTALTLSLIAPRVAPALAALKIGSLRPAAVRSYVERQFAEASVPIVRYYDHLQLVNQVQSTVREMKRSTGAGESGTPGTSAQPAGTGAMKGTAKPRRTGPVQQVSAPAASQQAKDPTLATNTKTSRGWGTTQQALLRLDSGPGQRGSSAMREERSKLWIA